ncbi:MAG: hypothetical protein M3388_10145 [Acidobacteriota bacterium]|nr:hypothetical protein [Acidobacteriota bacterium]
MARNRKKGKSGNQQQPKQNPSKTAAKKEPNSPTISKDIIPTLPQDGLPQEPFAPQETSSDKLSLWAKHNAVWGVVGLIATALAAIFPNYAPAILLGFALLIISVSIYRSSFLTSKSQKFQFIVKTSFVILITATFYFLWSGFKPNSTQRPFIDVNQADLQAPINSGKFPVGKFRIQNTGEKPAVNVKINVYSALVKNEIAKQIKQGIMPDMKNDATKPRSVGVLGVGGYGFFSTEDVGYENSNIQKDTIKGIWFFYVWGEIFYSDIDGKEYRTKFCSYNENIDSIVFTYCDKWNDAS